MVRRLKCALGLTLGAALLWLAGYWGIRFSYDLGARPGLYGYETLSSQRHVCAVVATSSALVAVIVTIIIQVMFADLHATWRLLLNALVVEISFVIYAVLGLGSAVNSTESSSLFPSLLFAEFNWLTFIFMCGPMSALASAVLATGISRFCLCDNVTK